MAGGRSRVWKDMTILDKSMALLVARRARRRERLSSSPELREWRSRSNVQARTRESRRE